MKVIKTISTGHGGIVYVRAGNTLHAVPFVPPETADQALARFTATIEAPGGAASETQQETAVSETVERKYGFYNEGVTEQTARDQPETVELPVDNTTETTKSGKRRKKS